MTRVAVFVQWSAMIAYNLLGLTIIAVPQIWKGFLQLEFSGRTEGYFRLQAVARFEHGFLYCISLLLRRSKSDVPGNLEPFSSVSCKVTCNRGPGPTSQNPYSSYNQNLLFFATLFMNVVHGWHSCPKHKL